MRVARRVDFDLLADPIVRLVHPARISELIETLSDALEFASRLEGSDWLPRLVADQLRQELRVR